VAGGVRINIGVTGVEPERHRGQAGELNIAASVWGTGKRIVLLKQWPVSTVTPKFYE
jgi:hypothetical protein